MNVIPPEGKNFCDFALLCIKRQTNYTFGLEVKNYMAEETRTCAVEMMSENKSAGGEPHVFQCHHFNKAARQGSSLFQERLKCGPREFVVYCTCKQFVLYCTCKQFVVYCTVHANSQQ